MVGLSLSASCPCQAIGAKRAETGTLLLVEGMRFQRSDGSYAKTDAASKSTLGAVDLRGACDPLATDRRKRPASDPKNGICSETGKDCLAMDGPFRFACLSGAGVGKSAPSPQCCVQVDPRVQPFRQQIQSAQLAVDQQQIEGRHRQCRLAATQRQRSVAQRGEFRIRRR